MTPKQITLYNFLSYKEQQTFSFEGLNLACFHGKNGHGKSGFIDALTWCLWGEIIKRKPSGKNRIEDVLLHTDETLMFVEVVFEEHGETYRVIRKYEKKKKEGKRYLDIFYIKEKEEICLSADLLTQNIEILNNILSMSYETFINTSYLVQGRYNEFTAKIPSKRKDLLIPLVVPKEYQVIYSNAKEERRKLNSQKNAIEEQIETLKERIKEKESIQEQTKELLSTIGRTQTSLEKLEKYQETLNEKRTEIDQQEKRKITLEEALVEKKHTLETQKEQLELLQNDNKKHEEILRREQSIEKEHQLYEQSTQKLQDISSLYRQYKQFEIEYQKERLTILQTKEQLTYQLSTINENIKDCNLIIEEKETIEQQYKDYEDTCKKLELLYAEKDTFDNCIQEEKRITDELEQKKEKLVIIYSELQGKISSFPSEEKLLNDIAETLEEINRIQECFPEHQDKQQLLNDYKHREYQLQEDIHRLKSEITVLQTNRSFLEAASERISINEKTDEIRCPICETVITEEHNDIIQQHFKETQKLIGDKKDQQKLLQLMLEEQKKETTTLSEILVKLNNNEQRLEKLQGELKDYSLLRKDISQTNEQIEALVKQKTDELNDTQKQRSQCLYKPEKYQELTESIRNTNIKLRKQRLDEALLSRSGLNDRKHSLEGDLNTILKTIKKKFYEDEKSSEMHEIENIVKESHDMTFSEIQSLEQYVNELKQGETTHQLLQTIKTERQLLTQKIEHLCERINQGQQQYNSIKQKHDSLYNLKEQKEKVIKERHDNKAAILINKNSLKNYNQEYGKLTKHLEHIKQIEGTIDLKEQRLHKAKKEIALHKMLIDICGPNGIPAELLKKTIYETEIEANDLLQKFASSTKILFETEKELKSGDTKGTLDIKILSEGSFRYYESYSGGQQFRIDFAIRVALSKVLARQAGSPLDVFIIDEGFGTQDKEGIDSIITCLKTISSDFKYVFVITHITEIKEAFDTQVHFYLDPVKGSMFKVS